MGIICFLGGIACLIVALAGSVEYEAQTFLIGGFLVLELYALMIFALWRSDRRTKAQREEQQRRIEDEQQNK